MNDKLSWPWVVAIAIVALGIGFLAGKFLFRSLFFVAVNKAELKVAAAAAGPVKRTALITLQNNAGTSGTCAFTDGNNKTYKYPVIRPNHGVAGTGDTILWFVQDGRPAHSGSLKFTLTFLGAGPFTRPTFDDGHNNSGESNADTGDYPYKDIAIQTSDAGTVHCKNPGDPGVHGDQ